jgi:hypothetical protein
MIESKDLHEGFEQPGSALEIAFMWVCALCADSAQS